MRPEPALCKRGLHTAADSSPARPSQREGQAAKKTPHSQKEREKYTTIMPEQLKGSMTVIEREKIFKMKTKKLSEMKNI